MHDGLPVLPSSMLDPILKTDDAALAIACATGHIDIVKRLLECKSVELYDDKGPGMAFYVTVGNHRYRIMDMLLHDSRFSSERGAERALAMITLSAGMTQLILPHLNVDPTPAIDEPDEIFIIRMRDSRSQVNTPSLLSHIVQSDMVEFMRELRDSGRLNDYSLHGLNLALTGNKDEALTYFKNLSPEAQSQ